MQDQAYTILKEVRIQSKNWLVDLDERHVFILC